MHSSIGKAENIDAIGQDFNANGLIVTPRYNDHIAKLTLQIKG